MPEYLAPGVYVEETSFRAKSIEGVGTSTTAFAGPTRKGPVSGGERAPETPELLTSFGDFERIYGGLADLDFDGTPTPNYLAHAVLAYFNEGGSRLYVSRVVVASAAADDGGATVATAALTAADADEADAVAFRARFAGAAGNGSITLLETVAPASKATMDAAPPGTWLRTGDDDAVADHVKVGDAWYAADALDGDPEDTATLYAAGPRIVSLSVTARDGDGLELSWAGLGYDRQHPRWVGHVLAATPSRRADHLQNAFAIEIGADVDAPALRTALFGEAEADGLEQVSRSVVLQGGSDGTAPQSTDYRNALDEIAALEDVSIVAAPGAVAYGDGDNATSVLQDLIAHASRPRAYRIAVLDTPQGLVNSEVRELRGQIDSKYAALYYPWVVVPNPNARPGRDDIPRELPLPPSGYVCGIYARNDVERGVHKAPANEVVRSALRFEINVNQGQQEVLNPIGVNCLRLLQGRGYRVWGARLVSSDPEWKYVSDRRYFNYLEASIDRGTQWAVFEPNGERLWANVRQTISDFLYNEWRNGALLGSTQEEAYFVRCDRSTMTQNDLDNGRLICLIGVAIVKPAEFVIFRIGQKTADQRA